MRLRYADVPGALGRMTSAIGEANGVIGAVDIVDVRKGSITRDITVNASDVEHGEKITDVVRGLDGVEVLQVSDRTFLMHLGGKIEVTSKVPVKTRDDLSMAYTPGVARVCMAIHEDPDASFALTVRRNTVAVVSDGSAVLGLGDIGPKAAMPVMEGKALLFKEFAGVDAFPICLDTHDVDEIVRTCELIAPTFGGINLEDISAPRCVEIEERLIPLLEIPVFHDDQHGTAVVVLAALHNALKVVGKDIADIRIVVNGAGAAGVAVTKLLKSVGANHIVACDRSGAIFVDREPNLNPVKQWLADHTNTDRVSGTLSEVIAGADVFIGVSGPDVLSVADIQNMAADPIVFALANPDPEINPELATPHVRVMATGRSDYPNQINNVLCFPGLFRGMLDVRARRVTEEMKVAAAVAIAGVLTDNEILEDYIVPSVFDRRVAPAVAEAVANAAVESGVARRLPKKVLLEHPERFVRRAGRAIEVRKAVVRNLDKQRNVDLPPGVLTDDIESVIQDDSIDIAIQLLGGTEPAREVMLALLKSGKDVVTANKALIYEHGDELFQTARSLGRVIAFEASVCGGVPIIAGIGQALAANQITSIEAILNGTSNFILTGMFDGRRTYEDMVAEAQRQGYAEADPSMDVDGTDAAHKLVILSQLAFGTKVPISDFTVRGIDTLELADLLYADELGYAVKLLAVAKLADSQLELHVQPTLIRRERPLAGISDVYNRVAIEGDVIGTTWFSGMGAGQMATASAVLADLIDVAVGRTALTFGHLDLWRNQQPLAAKRVEDVEGRYYIRFNVEDRPHVLADIADVLGRNGISLASIIQHEAPELTNPDAPPTVPLVVMTHRTSEGRLQSAEAELDQLPSQHPPRVRMAVAD
eukprot:g26707.t1